MGDNVGGPVVIVPTFTVTINPMEDDEESVTLIVDMPTIGNKAKD